MRNPYFDKMHASLILKYCPHITHLHYLLFCLVNVITLTYKIFIVRAAHDSLLAVAELLVHLSIDYSEDAYAWSVEYCSWMCGMLMSQSCICINWFIACVYVDLVGWIHSDERSCWTPRSWRQRNCHSDGGWKDEPVCGQTDHQGFYRLAQWFYHVFSKLPFYVIWKSYF